MIKKAVIVGLISFIACLAMPFMMVLNRSLGDYLLTQFAYKSLDNRIAHDINDGWSKVKALNSWFYINEEQSVSWLDVRVDAIDFNSFFDLIRGIGWCDQKAGGLINLLNVEGIKGRIIFFPSHTIAEITIDNEVRYFDPTFNTELIIKNDRFVRVDGKPYEGYVINNESPRYGDYNDASLIRNLAGWMIGKYPRFYVGIWLEWYLKVRGNDLIKLDSITVSPIYSEQYNSQGYESLYKGRIYQLLGEYDKAQSYYELMLSNKQFRDETVFYLVTLGLSMQNQEIVDKYAGIARSELAGVRDSERSYLFFVDSYLKRYSEVYGGRN